MVTEMELFESTNTQSFFLGASSPLCWFNKEFCVLHVQPNTTTFHPVVQ